MSASLSVLGLELRMLRRDLLLALLALSGVGAVRLVYGAEPYAGPGLQPYALGGLLLGVILVGTTRSLALGRAWAGMRGAVPLPHRQVHRVRALFWAVCAAGLALGYVCLAAPGRLGDAPALHVALVWLWALAAGALVHGVAAPERHATSATASAVRIYSCVAILGVTLPTAVTGRDVWLPMGPAALLVACAVLLELVNAVRGDDEWLPSQSPKELRPRRRAAGGLRRGPPRVRSPRQVLGHLGVRGDLASFLALWPLGMGIALLFGDAASGSAPVGWAALVVLGCGLVALVELRRASASWALLRAYPLSRAAVWARPVGRLLAVAVLGLGAGAWAYQARAPGRLVGNLDLHEDQFTGTGPGWALPALRVPGWARSAEATHERPAEMPAPRWGVWPLRERRGVHVAGPGMMAIYGDLQQQGGIRNEARYFVDALHYYLDLVHGVRATDEELLAALGPAIVIDQRITEIPLQHYLEHTSSDGTRLFSHPMAKDATHVTVELPERRGDGALEPLRAIEMYAYAPALERLEARLGDRLARAARQRSVLELCLLVLAILVFVRCALIDGPMRWTAPVLALVAIGLWHGSRATALHRAVRDLHVEHVWIAPALTIVAGTLLIRSIHRQLGRSAPAPLAASTWMR